MALSEQEGIIGAGNWIVDTTKIIDRYPEQDQLADIEAEQRNNGGGAFNILCDLAQLGVSFPLRALGLLGRDSAGDWIVERCRAAGIDTRLFQRHDTAPTSYTDVMTVRGTGRRTFFHQRGSNRFLGPEHFPWDQMEGRIFYLGYLLLLDTLDTLDPVYGSVAAGILKEAGRRGFYRFVDLVSVKRPDYRAILQPALAEIDLLVCNELEVQQSTGISVVLGNECSVGQMRKAASALLAAGVKDWVVIHLPAGAYARSARGEEAIQGSVRLPYEYIVGAAGAGDAFAAGILHGLHEGVPMSESLLRGVCAAASCLQHATTSEGVTSLPKCLQLGERFGFRPFR